MESIGDSISQQLFQEPVPVLIYLGELMTEPVKESQERCGDASLDLTFQDLSQGDTPRKKQQPMGMMRQLSRQDSRSSPGLRDDRGWTPLHVAARMGDLTEVQRLIDEGADANEPSSGPKAPGTTPLHLAATGGHVAVMDELLEHGANMEARTKGGCGWTPLHNAAKEKNKKAVHFLLENGAFLPPDMTDGCFNPPLHYCPGLEWAYKLRNKLLVDAAKQQ